MPPQRIANDGFKHPQSICIIVLIIIESCSIGKYFASSTEILSKKFDTSNVGQDSRREARQYERVIFDDKIEDDLRLPSHKESLFVGPSMQSNSSLDGPQDTTIYSSLMNILKSSKQTNNQDNSTSSSQLIDKRTDRGFKSFASPDDLPVDIMRKEQQKLGPSSGGQDLAQGLISRVVPHDEGIFDKVEEKTSRNIRNINVNPPMDNSNPYQPSSVAKIGSANDQIAPKDQALDQSALVNDDPNRILNDPEQTKKADGSSRYNFDEINQFDGADRRRPHDYQSSARPSRATSYSPVYEISLGTEKSNWTPTLDKHQDYGMVFKQGLQSPTTLPPISVLPGSAIFGLSQQDTEASVDDGYASGNNDVRQSPSRQPNLYLDEQAHDYVPPIIKKKKTSSMESMDINKPSYNKQQVDPIQFNSWDKNEPKLGLDSDFLTITQFNQIRGQQAKQLQNDVMGRNMKPNLGFSDQVYDEFQSPAKAKNRQPAYLAPKRTKQPPHYQAQQQQFYYSLVPAPSAPNATPLILKSLPNVAGVNGGRTITIGAQTGPSGPSTSLFEPPTSFSHLIHQPVQAATSLSQKDLINQPQTIQITSVPGVRANNNPLIRINTLPNAFNNPNAASWVDPTGRQVVMVNADRRQIDWSSILWPILVVVGLPVILSAIFVPLFVKSLILFIQILQSLGLLVPITNAIGHAAGFSFGNMTNT